MKVASIGGNAQAGSKALHASNFRVVQLVVRGATKYKG